MAERVRVTEPCFAKRVLWLLEQHSAQRKKDQDARRRELQVVKSVFEVMSGQRTRRGEDSGRYAGSRGHHREGSLEQRSEGSCSTREAGHRCEYSGCTTVTEIPSPPPPPGLEAFEPRRDAGPDRRNGSNLIPSEEWKTMCRDAQEAVRLLGRRLRQKRRRQRITEQRRGVTAEHDATDMMRAHGAHPDFPWQRQCRQPWQQYWEPEQRLPQALQRPYGASSDHMWINKPPSAPFLGPYQTP